MIYNIICCMRKILSQMIYMIIYIYIYYIFFLNSFIYLLNGESEISKSISLLVLVFISLKVNTR